MPQFIASPEFRFLVAFAAIFFVGGYASARCFK